MSFRPSPASISLVYAALAGSWIALSTTFITRTIEDPVLWSRIELFKGFGFVAVTSLLLYLVLRMQLADRQDPIADDKTTGISGTRPLLLMAICALAVPLITLAAYALNSAQEEQRTRAVLQSMAAFKAGQIEVWLSERTHDADVLVADAGFIERVQRLQQSNDDRERALVRNRLAAMVRSYSYDTVVLLDASGRPMLEVGKPQSLSQQTAALVPQALASGRPLVSDLAFDTTGSPRLSLIVPLLSGDRKVGAVVLDVDPEHSLYPMIKTWPATGLTGETLLARREGDTVLFLNELRHRSGTALRFRQPVDAAELPAAVAARSAKPGTMQGVDYRGVQVLAAYRAVPGTNWHIVAKVDRDEAMAPARKLAAWVGLIALFAYAIMAAVVLALHREQQRTHRLSLQAQSDRLLKQFYDLPFIGMAVTSPETRRWDRFNDRLCEILGYSREELSQKDWMELTHPEDLEKDVTEFERVLRGESEGYAMDKRFIRKDGAIVHSTIDVKCVRKPDGTVDYFVAMVQDITARKTAEEGITRLARLYETLSRVNTAIVKSSNEAELFLVICRAAVESAGMTMAWVGLVDAETGMVRPVASHGAGAEYLDGICISVSADDPHGRGPTGTAIRENQPIWCQDFRHDPRTAPWHARGTAMGWVALAALPLTRGGVAIGAITLYTTRLNAFDAQTQALLVEMAQDTSFALDSFDREWKRRQAERETMEQLDELRRWNTATLNREERILDLKREVNELLGAAGAPPRYPSAENDKQGQET